jgi:cytochrome c-type biogenesis protein CcmH
MMRLLLCCVLLGMALPAAAIPVGMPLEFDTPEQEQDYQSLIRELRCTVCQNQSLVDSNAGLARDLRGNIYELIQEGRNQAEITEYMVSRYGDFVLYRPPMQPNTYLLWFGPFLFLALGAVVLMFVVASRRRVADRGLTPEEQARLKEILRRQS